MAIAPEKSDGIIPWRGPMEDAAITKGPSEPFVLNLPGLKKDVPSATATDDDTTLIWGDWSGGTDYEAESALDDELRAAVGMAPLNLGS